MEIVNSKNKAWVKSEGYFFKEGLKVAEQDFVDDVYNELFLNSKFRKLNLYRQALDSVLANLILYGRGAHGLINPIKKNYIYYNKWATKIVIKNIFNTLVENEYCVFYKGFFDFKNKSRSYSGKYVSTIKILNRFLHVKNKKLDSILLYKKNPNGIRIPKDYSKTWFTKKMENEVGSINKLLKSSTVCFKYNNTNPDFRFHNSFENSISNLLDTNHIKISVEQNVVNKDIIWMDTIYENRLYIDNEYNFEINKESMYLYRSFARGDFMYGGRFYTPIFQSIPSVWRNTITIDGEDTVELDYSAHHIRLLYHKEKIDFVGEPYLYSKDDIEHKDERIINKYIMMISINAKDRKSAISAIFTAIKMDKASGKYNSVVPSKTEITIAYDKFLEHHKPIAKYVGNDAGIKLQKLDSEIMNLILIELTKKGIVALPVHDSVIVQKRFEKELKEEMERSYFLKMGFQPVVN